ncbi:MAG TPA: hypothetical protein DFR83_03685 [Deltaproteobacteria bacterium]|nr:hypothetical protein [Deltaproteobacteria bacterium]
MSSSPRSFIFSGFSLPLVSLMGGSLGCGTDHAITTRPTQETSPLAESDTGDLPTTPHDTPDRPEANESQGDPSTVGCEDSLHDSLRDGVAAAIAAGAPRLFVCAGVYDVSQTIEIHNGITIVGDPTEGGVTLVATATPVFSALSTSPGSAGIDELAFGTMTVECAPWNEGTYNPEGGDGIQLDRGTVTLTHVDWIGCGASIVRSSPSQPLSLQVVGGSILDGGQGMWLWGNGLDAELDGLHLEGLTHEGIFFSPDTSDGMHPSNLHLQDLTVVENETSAAGNLLDIQCISDAAPTMSLHDSLLVRNRSTTNAAYGAGGVLFMGIGCEQASLHIEDSTIVGNTSAAQRAGGAYVYSGRLVSVNTNWGRTDTPNDNLPTDVYMWDVPELAVLDGVVSFDCTAGVGCR